MAPLTTPRREELFASLMRMAFRYDQADDRLREMKELYPEVWEAALAEVQERKATTKYGSLVWEAIYEPAACPLRKASTS